MTHNDLIEKKFIQTEKENPNFERSQMTCAQQNARKTNNTFEPLQS